MGQIVKKKKKGRPSKADLAARRSSGSAAEKSDGELRRSGRRRNVRYAFDIDDDEYFVDEDEEEDESRREKKLKLLLKLQNMEGSGCGGGGGVAESTPSPTRHVRHAPTASGSSSDFGDGGKPSKIRKIDGDCEVDEEYEENDGGDDGDIENDGDEGRGRKAERKTISTASGTLSEHPSGIPLPDKKTLELILNKLQKKDIYGVYAEPVDPEELPDYHDVIEHPMDFQTVKNKLGNGSYATLEQFESDVFLICSNAMQYNAPDTIYYKQARSIQELAEKKFQKLRINFERTENTKSEQKPKSSTAVKKVMKKPIGWMVQKPVGSDFFSGATLATAGDIQNGSNAFHLGDSERPSSIDRLIERNSSAIDNNMDKEESHLGKALSRFGRKSAVPDENRRATYNITSQPVTNLESIFTTFDGESKQLVPVGLYTDYSYARSLARFAATLGPNVWKVASRRIEQALPPGFKFGRGWVGEYEELPTPVLMPENYTLKEPAFLAKFMHRTDAEKDKFVNPASSKENKVKGPKTEGQLPYFSSSGTKSTADNSPNISINGDELPVSDANIGSNAFVTGISGNKPSGSASPKYHQQNSQPQNFIKAEKKLVKHVELNSVPLANERNANFSSQSQDRQVTKSVAVPGSRSFETVPMNINMLSSGSYKQLNINGVSAGVPDGKSPNSGFDSNGTVGQPSNDFVNSMNKAATLFANGQGQGLSDTVRRMILSEKNPNQQKFSSQQARVDVPPVSPATVSFPKDGPNNASSAATRAWMSIGEARYKQAGENINSQNNQISPGSTHNPRDFQSQFREEPPAYGMYIQPGKGKFPFHAFVPHPARVGTEGQSPYEPMVFPQSVPADLSRFQVQQSSRPNLNAPAPARQKRESVPPDLNVSFQSSGSPGRPSGVLVDSQHPDLALQL